MLNRILQNQDSVADQASLAAKVTTTATLVGGSGIALFKNRVVPIITPQSRNDPQTPFPTLNATATALNATTGNGSLAAAAGVMNASHRDTPVGLFVNARSAVPQHTVTLNTQTPDARLLSRVATQYGGSPVAKSAGDGLNNHQGNPQTLTTITPRGPIVGGSFAACNNASMTPRALTTTTTPGAFTAEMAPPPVRRPVVTPASVAAFNPRESTPASANQLFPMQHQKVHNDFSTLLPPCAASNANDSINNNSDESFHNIHQQFSITMRDFHDKESQYKDTLLDSTVKLDLATALLLHIKAESLDLTDQLDDLSYYYHESIQSIATE